MSLINITKFHTWRGVSMHFITAVSVFTLIDAYLSVYLLQAGSHYVAWAAWHWNAGSVKQSCLFISGEFWILTELFSLFIFKRGGDAPWTISDPQMSASWGLELQHGPPHRLQCTSSCFKCEPTSHRRNPKASMLGTERGNQERWGLHA